MFVSRHKSNQQMRTSAVLFLALIGSVTLVKGQTIIPRIGITSATATMERGDLTTGQNTGSITGLTFGVGYNLPVSTFGKVMFSLQPEFVYLQKGFTVQTSGEFNIGEAIYQFEGENKNTLNYLEIPVLSKFEYGSDKFKVALFAGPSIGFALGGRYKSESRVDTGEEVEVYTSKGKIVFYDANEENTASFDHNIDFGIQGGASFTFFNRVSLDVRYGKSFTNLIHDVDSKHKVLQFSVGVPIARQ
jgi:Outer membrane protein beta-barrel domain